MSEKSAEYFLGLPYTIEFVHDKSDPGRPVWFASVRELKGCMTEADEFEDAARQIREAMIEWIADAIDAGDSVPEPRNEDEFSGKFSVRLPRSLHRDLVRRAEDEGVSLNQYITSVLSRAVE
ncbi:MAG: type II toxin-antitoxin system HicB family antitoxin [Anaerolineae bacterium]|nr:type II toxin-antitoxin system HicB family antitoxin [Anaerolineae bacterium]